MNKENNLVDVTSMPNSPLYKWFGENNMVKSLVKEQKLYKTWSHVYKVYSENSCAFADLKNPTEENIKSIIKETFGITSNCFGKKFHEAISGDGQELQKIAVLHSSSLIALLCFYRVNEQPLTMTIDGIECTFTKSYLECKNEIENNPHPSNIDVVLTGKNAKNESVILFLESKFSEYLTGGKKDEIKGYVYDEIYEAIGQLDNLKIQKENDMWSISSNSNTQHYCDGIKQMISHYLGVTNGFKKGHWGLSDTFNCADYQKVYLGEILFHFDDDIDNGKYDDYNALYRQLSSKLNAISKDNKLTVLPNVLSYQEIFSNSLLLDDKVKDFYCL